MSTLLTALLAMLPRVFFAILAKLLTEAALTRLLENVLLALMDRAAALTTNTVDDAFVADARRRFQQDTDAPRG